jgi:hypothetical protein
MPEKQTPTTEEAQNVTELPKPRKPFAWKKYAKYAAYGTTAVISAIVIFKLASEPEPPKVLGPDESVGELKVVEVDENVA